MTKDARVTVSASPAVALEILFSRLDNVFAHLREESTLHERPVTCTNGCAQCCAMVVEVTLPEAVVLADDVERLPGKKRRETIERLIMWSVQWHRHFARQQSLLGLAGDADHMQMREMDNDESRRKMAAIVSRWQVQRLACPFLNLKDYSCSVYHHRPLSCRSLMVVEPNEPPTKDQFGRPSRRGGRGCATTEEDAEAGLLPPLTTITVNDITANAVVALVKMADAYYGKDVPVVGILPVMVLTIGMAKYNWPHPDSYRLRTIEIPTIPLSAAVD